jgi:hypothetical protein
MLFKIYLFAISIYSTYVSVASEKYTLILFQTSIVNGLGYDWLLLGQACNCYPDLQE